MILEPLMRKYLSSFSDLLDSRIERISGREIVFFVTKITCSGFFIKNACSQGQGGTMCYLRETGWAGFWSFMLEFGKVAWVPLLGWTLHLLYLLASSLFSFAP